MSKGPTVSSVLIRNRVGRILIFEDRKGFVALPGGTSEPEETPEKTAIRESLEETGLRINIKKLVASYNLTVFNEDGTERSKFHHYLFLASTKDTNPKPSAEWRNSEARCKWTTMDGLRRYKGVWPLPELVRKKVSEGNLDLGNLGELTYHMK